MTDLVFISDLHLMPRSPGASDAGIPDSGKLFRKFATEVAASADRLYILGDFLEVWWGDDAPDEGYTELADTLRWLNDETNTGIFLIHGNRDFLIGQQLAKPGHVTSLD